MPSNKKTDINNDRLKEKPFILWLNILIRWWESPTNQHNHSELNIYNQ